MADNSAKVLAKFDYLKKHPNKPKKDVRIAYIISTILFFFLGWIAILVNKSDGYFIIALCLGPVAYVYGYYKSLGKDLLKIQIATANDWFYDPNKDKSKWKSLKNSFSEIFNRGDNSQFIEDQFWGNIGRNMKTFNFYSGLFTFYRHEGSGKRRRNQRYENHFFAIKLDKKLNSRFHLYPESFFSNGFGLFKKKDVNEFLIAKKMDLTIMSN